MKKPRLQRWRWLLALLLGAGTWWGVGWWLSPRPYWEATYDTHQFASQNMQPAIKGESSEVEIEQLGKRLPAQLRATVLDQQGRYLLIDQLNVEGPYHYEVIDLNTRQKVARHALSQPGLVARHLKSYKQLAAKDHVALFPIIQMIEEEGKLFLHRNYFHTQLWQWNVLTREATLLKKYPKGTTLDISHDGSTMLEIQRLTVMQPSLLLQDSIPNLLAGVVESHLRYSDLAVYRIWSLPSRTLRSTVTLPWIHRQNDPGLTADGKYLVFTDVALPEGMTSAHLINKENASISRGHHVPHYATHPTGCLVFDTMTGRLVSEYHSDHSVYFGLHSVHPDFAFMLGDEHQTNQKPDLGLHLPTMIWKEGRARRIASFDSRHVHAAEYVHDDHPHFDIQIVARDGTTRHVGRVKVDDLSDLLPHASQYLSEHSSRRGDVLPRWLLEWLDARDILVKWLSEESNYLEIRDYTNERTLLRLRSPAHVDYSITDRWLIVSEDDYERLRVSVFALPFASWSPLWPHSAGLLAFILCAYWLRQRPKGIPTR